MFSSKNNLDCKKKEDKNGNEKLVCKVGDGAVVAKKNKNPDEDQRYSYLPRNVSKKEYRKVKPEMKKMLDDTEGLSGEH